MSDLKEYFLYVINKYSIIKIRKCSLLLHLDDQVVRFVGSPVVFEEVCTIRFVKYSTLADRLGSTLLNENK